MIYTGGISISERETTYVMDALNHGWDEQASKYIRSFEKKFCEYTGAKYARTLSGGTQALTMALATLDLKPGDEVILPDLTYFACSDVIKLQGATPVFVDVDPLTLCMRAEDFENAITEHTKAVMPVWLYGNAPDIENIARIAKEREIYVVEDACPAVGSFFKGKHAGTFGDFGCFSFHAAKIMTTGFGGMLVTNDEKLYDRMIHLADHGEDKTYPQRFWQTDIGYTFDLPNINCAMGLAQLERIHILRDKHRQIYKWYKERLGYHLNYAQKDADINYSMITCILPEKVDRDQVIKELKKEGIDSRPVFFPISKFPMYTEVWTPNAHYASLHGINLPFGIQRTEEEIDLICKELKRICAEYE